MLKPSNISSFVLITATFARHVCNAFPFIATTKDWKGLNQLDRNLFSYSQNSRLYSDWSDFAYEDEDEILDIDFADEYDSQEYKAEIGQMLPPPEIEMYADPIFVPQGK